jgi:hypothetical protein
MLLVYRFRVPPVHITNPSANTDGWDGYKTRTEVYDRFFWGFVHMLIVYYGYELDFTSSFDQICRW